MDPQAEFQMLFDAYVERYLAGDAAGCAAFYAQNGEIHSPFGPPIIGREAITNAHIEWFREGEFNKVVTITNARSEGTIGFCAAQYSADVPQDDGTSEKDAGTSINTFEKDPKDNWKIRHTSLNPQSV